MPNNNLSKKNKGSFCFDKLFSLLLKTPRASKNAHKLIRLANVSAQMASLRSVIDLFPDFEFEKYNSVLEERPENKNDASYDPALNSGQTLSL